MTRRERRLLTVPALLVAGALTLAACGGSSTPKAAASPTASASAASTAATPDVPVPSGVTLTTPGAELSFGDAATVPYAPNEKRSSVLELTVEGATRAPIKDFGAYVLDKRTKASTPYYVRVVVKNVGTGDVGGTDVPLWAVDQDNVLIHASSFTNSFSRCPSKNLPADFGPGAKVKSCLVYLVPHHGTMTAASFRPLQAVDPITWTGTIKNAAGTKHHHRKAAGKKKS